jgi:hypothetical protein
VKELPAETQLARFIAKYSPEIAGTSLQALAIGFDRRSEYPM